MKLFVVVFGAALAASMVAADPENADLTPIGFEELVCTGALEEFEVFKFSSCNGDNACIEEAKVYAFENDLIYEGASCCSFGAGLYDANLATPFCINVNTHCNQVLATASGKCNTCVAKFLSPNIEPEPCCAPCCEEPTESLWKAIKHELQGSGGDAQDKNKIWKQWFKHSTDNDHHLHFHEVQSCGTYNLDINIKDIVDSGEDNAGNKNFTCYKACCDCCFDLQLTAMQSTVIKRDNKDECSNEMPDTLLWPKDVNRVSNANGAVCFATYYDGTNTNNIVVVLADFYRLVAYYYEENFYYTYEGGAISQLLFTYMCNQKATVAHAISNRWTDSAPAPAPAPAL